MKNRPRAQVGLVPCPPPPDLLMPVPVFGAGGPSTGAGRACLRGSPSPLVLHHGTGPSKGDAKGSGVQQCLVSYLGKLEPPKVAGWACDLEDFLWHHPRLQRLEFAHGQIGRMMLDHKALEAVSKEVEVDRRRVAHGIVPGTHTHTQSHMSLGSELETCRLIMGCPIMLVLFLK